MPATTRPRFDVDLETVPEQCPGCPYHASDPAVMVEHWIREKCYEEGPRGGYRFTPAMPHGLALELPTHLAAPLPLQVIVVAGGDVTVDLGWLRWVLYAEGVGAVVCCAMAGVVLFFLCIPLAFYPFLNWGPGKPVLGVLSFLWQHGELSLPLAAAAGVTFGVPSLRRRAWANIQFWSVRVTLATVGTFGAGFVGWLAGIALGLWHS